MAFQIPSKAFSKRDYQFMALAAILFIAFSAGLVFLNLKFEKGGGDFYVEWVAAHGFFSEEKTEPYSGDVAGRAQQLAYGSSAQAGDDPYILDTPFHIFLLYYPLKFFADPKLARALFTLLLELTLFPLTYLSLRLTDWEAPRLFTFCFMLFGLFNFYAYRALYEGNPTLLLGLLYVGIIIFYYAEADELVGALLALSFYRWEVGAPLLILVFLRAYYEKRTRVFAGFGMLSVVLLIVAFLLYPDWLIPYLRASWNSLRTPFGFSVFAVFSDLLPNYGSGLARIFVIGLFILLGYEFILARSQSFRQFYWACCLALAAAPLLGLQTELEHLAVLIVPLALVFSIIYQRWRKRGGWLALLLMIVALTLPWALHFLKPAGLTKTSNEIVFLFLPLFTLIGLYWIRWWALNPPRVWADLAADH
ncbi:MAG: hypothetical protein LC108_15715 [Anaerolineales bacterium]|nr:hypothetical protein [Anaerolineales bacterium]